MRDLNTILDIKFIHRLFTQFVEHHPRPLSVHFLKGTYIDELEGYKSKWLVRSIQRLIKNWVQLGMIEDLGRSTCRSSKYYRLSKYGELFLKIYRTNANVNFYDNPKFKILKKDISYRYFTFTYFAVCQNKSFKLSDLQKLGDCLNYHIHGRSWQRNINLFIEAGIISCERQCPSESYNYHVIKASIHAFVKSEPIERIEFEKNLLNLGIVNNYEKYIDYNNLLFHVLFSKWINSPVDFGYFVDQNFYGAS